MSFQSIASSVRDWVETGVVPGVAIAIELRGERVADFAAGDAQPGVPASPETLFALASVSKPVTAAGVMIASDQGAFGLDDAVTSILPDFGADVDPYGPTAVPMLEAQRDDITIRQLLAHLSGLPENVGPIGPRAIELPTADQQIDAMLQVPLISAPGDYLRYSNLGPAIAARAVEAATGVPFHQFVRQQVLDPLGLHDIALTPGRDIWPRIATVQDPGMAGTPAESYNSAWWREQGIPWGGYFGSVDAVLTFATSFLPGRSTPLSEASIRAMTTDQAHGVAGGVESMHAIWDPAFWGAGWEVKGTKRHHWTGDRTAPETWCHWGQSGTLVWADPTRELAMAVFANRTVKSPWPLRPPRWAALSNAIVEEADRSAG